MTTGPLYGPHVVPGSGLPGDRGQQGSLSTHVGARRAVQEAQDWEEDSLHIGGWGGCVPQRMRGCVCSFSYVSQLTHLEWLPALVRGRCGGGGTILCTPGRTQTKSAMRCTMGKRQEPPSRPSQPQGCIPPSAGAALVPSQNSRHLPLATQDSIAPRPGHCMSPHLLPVHTRPEASVCEPGAVLPSLFRKLLDETRLASRADVILWTREQVSMILGFRHPPWTAEDRSEPRMGIT